MINLARLLWGFNIEHAIDENGDPIPVDFTTDGLVPGAMSNAKPFQCCRIPSRARADNSDHSTEPEKGDDHA